MIISDSQVRLALEYLQTTNDIASDTSVERTDVPDELVARVRRALASLPDTRIERIEEARQRLDDGLDSEEVADKMIGRIISDSLR